MKNRIFFSIIMVLFLIEIAILTLFALPNTVKPQDTVAVNEVLQTVQSHWNSLADHKNHTDLDYTVLARDGAVLYQTRPGLSENINAAISHKDTILTIETGGRDVGRLIIYNNDASIFQAEKQDVMITVISAMLIQFCICAVYFFYMQRAVIKPFHKLKGFAERIAQGNLDIPLEMDRNHLFGAFTESFDIMRSELKKARIAEAKANESKRELVAKLSHDIKTPVASIKAASEIGAALSPDPKTRKNYEQIILKADQINTLITNLFSAALEELQELSVTPESLKSGVLYALLENADYLHRAVIPSVPACMLSADRLRLQQVFDNLFANSYKYADTKINVKIYLEDHYLAVSIEDYGSGIQDDELPLLKEKFKRGSNAGNIEGAGLGLYISDYCMKKMLGRLDLENGSAGLKVIVRIALCRTI